MVKRWLVALVALLGCLALLGGCSEDSSPADDGSAAVGDADSDGCAGTVKLGVPR